MTEKDLRVGYRGLAISGSVIFLINFLILWASPDVPWDTALVRSANYTFWVVLVVGLLFEAFLKTVRWHHAKKVQRGR